MSRTSTSLVLLAAAFPSAAWACPVCGGGSEANGQAFLDMTLFMTMMPLLLVGTGALGLWLRYRQLQRHEADAFEETAPNA